MKWLLVLLGLAWVDAGADPLATARETFLGRYRQNRAELARACPLLVTVRLRSAEIEHRGTSRSFPLKMERVDHARIDLYAMRDAVLAVKASVPTADWAKARFAVFCVPSWQRCPSLAGPDATESIWRKTFSIAVVFGQ